MITLWLVCLNEKKSVQGLNKNKCARLCLCVPHNYEAHSCPVSCTKAAIIWMFAVTALASVGLNNVKCCWQYWIKAGIYTAHLL